MGHSILAFNDEARAATFASEVGGEVILWDVVFALPESKGHIGHHHMDTDMDNDATQHDHEG